MLTRESMLSYLDTRIRKLEEEMGCSMLSHRKLMIELETLKDIRSGINSGTIPNNSGLTHKESIRR